MLTDTPLMDMGISERIDVDGRASVERIMGDRFAVTYWCYSKDHTGLWVRAPRLYLVRPLSTLNLTSPHWALLRAQTSSTFTGEAKRLAN